jgi:APA family basic amino acid/polyamine antiporter
MAFVGLIAAFCSLEMVGHMTSIGTLMAFIMVCIGVLALRYLEPHVPRPFRTPWVPLVPLAGIAICILMMVSLGIYSWIRLIVWTAIGIIIYFFYGRYQSKW